MSGGAVSQPMGEEDYRNFQNQYKIKGMANIC